MAEELWSKSAGELARLIKSREASSRDVIESHLARIEQVNPAINAVVEVLADDARSAADAADAATLRGDATGPLHGVPFTVKINIDVTGSASSEGTILLKDLIAPSDAPMVERMRGAGGIVLGRTNMPDLGLRINTVSALYGATRNPFDRTRTVGGSSGGEAAAISSGMSPIGLGNDIGGSLRNPAYACGIASIKPSFGRVPAGNETAPIASPLASQIMLTQGVLARTVADVVTGLKVVAGAHPRDPFAVDVAYHGSPAPKRVALVAEPSGGFTDPGVAEGVRRAGRALEAAGYEVEEIEPPLLEWSYLAWGLLVQELSSSQRPLLEMVIGEEGKRFIDLTSQGYDEPTIVSMAGVHQLRQQIAQAWNAFSYDHPLIVGPTWTKPPFALGYDVESKETADDVMNLFRFVLPANLLGLPAACVPTGLANGLPVGAQIISRRMREDLCLEAAQVVEDAYGLITPVTPA